MPFGLDGQGVGQGCDRRRGLGRIHSRGPRQHAFAMAVQVEKQFVPGPKDQAQPRPPLQPDGKGLPARQMDKTEKADFLAHQFDVAGPGSPEIFPPGVPSIQGPQERGRKVFQRHRGVEAKALTHRPQKVVHRVGAFAQIAGGRDRRIRRRNGSRQTLRRPSGGFPVQRLSGFPKRPQTLLGSDQGRR